MDREFDLVLQGSTGFTGRLAARELARHAPSELRWAVAGRNPDKVAALAQELAVPALVADGLDADAVDALTARSRVVISCAGPFARYGSPLVAACVRNRCHYADLTGEIPWIYGLIMEHHEQASADGTTLIPASGFDSVPTDLALQQLTEEMRERELPVAQVRGYYRISGGLNGGTLASALHLYENWPQAMQAPTARSTQPFEVGTNGHWAAPFLMAAVNEWVVRRSSELLQEDGLGYGRALRYHEYLATRSRRRALHIGRGLRLMDWMMRRRGGRALLRALGPRPGRGPSPRKMREGFVHLTLHAGDGEVPDHSVEWSMVGDPGNRVTVRCLVQTGLALAAGEARRGGVLTPASALGAALRKRVLGADLD